MKRKKISYFLAIGLCGAVLAGCSSNDDTTDTSVTESEETQSIGTTSSESSTVTSKSNSSSGKKDSNKTSLHPEEADKDPIALENLELPEVYENTVIYNGTINPETTLRVIFPNEKSPYPDIHGSDLTETESFSITTNGQELKAGDQITFFVSGGGMDIEQDFYRTVQPAEEGKEAIDNTADTREEEQGLIEATTLPDIFPNTRRYEGQTVEDANVYYSTEDNNLSGNTKTARGDLAGQFYMYFNDINLQPGQLLNFYITENGITAKVEKQVAEMTTEQEEAIASIQETTYLPELYANTSTYYGKTIPGAEIVIANPYNSVVTTTVESNDSGDFLVPLESYREQINQMEVGDILLFTVTNENGYTESIETKVLPESDSPDYDGPVTLPE